MKILTGKQIAEADRYTIEHEPIAGIDLMERAAGALARWVRTHIKAGTPLCFFIGKGNNGGDGLAMARMLYGAGYPCRLYSCFTREEAGADCGINWDRLPEGLEVEPVERVVREDGMVVVDALLGTGVQGAVREPVLSAVERIGSLGCRVLSVDIPSGLSTEYGNRGRIAVRADDTLTIEYPKLALLLPEAGDLAGRISVLPIGLDRNYFSQTVSPFYFADEEFVRNLVLPRRKFAHKGDGGHALLVCGSVGMAGAAVLATGAALRSGCGLVTVHLPAEEHGVIHTTNPSAIVSCDPAPCFSQLPSTMDRYTAVGVGCGLGRDERSLRALDALLRCGRPMVIDADALNLLAGHPDLSSRIPPGSILTPHPGELRRLVGEWTDDGQRNRKAVALAERLACVVAVKGAHTMVCLPDGRMVFNATGNPGMAKGGSGDVLAGYLTGLLARGYDPQTAAVLGVYVHGRAGDKAAAYFGTEGMNSRDIVDFLGGALAELQ